jgi:Transient receptor potential (TRP) ion channel/ML-like domain
VYIGVYAYGEPRFDLTFNPCNANIWSLCPLNASVPIEANGVIPISQSDVSGIPPLALTIPDFEGQAILRIFANSTQSQIGCYSAVVTNGATFSHPAAVGTILGLFTLAALLSSVAAAVYGDSVSETRKHYAHSLSVFVVFAVFHHIFFTGALSVNWPSVLVAFWSNYAWSAGMIFSSPMQNSINQFLGANRGNISMVGAAASGVANDNLGGGYQISQIYKRAAAISFSPFEGLGHTLRPRSFEHALTRRQLLNSSTGFSWYGTPVRPGLPLPGNFSGFAGTVAEEDIPASNAFMTAFLWFLILLLCVAAGIALTKWVIEGLYRFRVMKTPRLAYFRTHWLNFLLAALLRTVFICFFMFMFLTMFQFTLGGSAGVLAVAAIVFVLFSVGMAGAAAYALSSHLRSGAHASEDARPDVERKKLFGFIPRHGVARESLSKEKDGPKAASGSRRWWRMYLVRTAPDGPSIHEDEDYIRRFGWLSSRFRRSKWWFFALWLVYEFVRACFYGGAAGHALTQVFGLLVVEFIAFVTIIFLKPFEGRRLNLLIVYVLGFSKVATVALSSAFDTRFNLQRIPTTIIGIVIIVIQGILTILLMIAIVLGAISTYMSLTRYHDEFKPQKWAGLRTRYLAHIDQTSSDRPSPPPPPTSPPPMPTEPTEPYFKVGSVRRQPKIEDDDDVDFEDIDQSKTSLSQVVPASTRQSRAQSIRSQASVSNLPYGARRHCASWSSRDLQQDLGHEERVFPAVHTRMSDASIRDTAARSHAQSMMDRVPSRTTTPTFPSRASITELGEKQRHRGSMGSTGFGKIEEGYAGGRKDGKSGQNEAGL